MWDLVVEAILWTVGGVGEQVVKYRLANAPFFQSKLGYRVGLFLEMAAYAPFAAFTFWRVLVTDEALNFSLWGSVVGGVLILIGVIINYVAVRDLKMARWNSAPLYGLDQELNSLVDTGIYSVIRHPSYVGQIIGFAGCAFILPSRYIITFAVIYMLYCVLIHTRIEDHYLVKRFGEKYVEYAQRVPAFLPLRGVRARK